MGHTLITLTVPVRGSLLVRNTHAEQAGQHLLMIKLISGHDGAHDTQRMKHTPRTPRSSQAPVDPIQAPTTGADVPDAPDALDAADNEGRIIEHPDGWYWMAPNGRQEFGPFESYRRARDDRDRNRIEGLGEDESLRDLEIEAGITDRVDIESGKPADDDIHQDDDAH
jgi:hypothetical protein